MYILGVSAFYHDSAAVLLKDDQIVAAAQEERFTRKKHDPCFPANAIKFCIDYEGISLKELDAFVFYDKPLLKFERLLETYYAFSPKGLRSFLSAIPVWVKEKMFIKKLIVEELSAIGDFNKEQVKILFPEHHLSHAASAFYPSPYDEAAILTIDGVGEWATASICHGENNRITMLRELRFPHSLGLLYSAFTYYLGFRVNSGEYKLMGLAPYGNPESEQVEKYVDTIKKHLVEIKSDGSIWLNQEYFDYATGLRMTNDGKWKDLFGFSPRAPEEELTQEHCDLALAIQRITEETVMNMASATKKMTKSKNLCLAGGVALNCVSNGKLLKTGLYENIWIQPAAGDAGGALGAAYAAYYLYFNKARQANGGTDRMRGSFLGPEYSEIDIRQTAKKHKAVYTKYDDFGTLCNDVARLMAAGNVVGWFQGRMEWGPRALGNRSIIGDARNVDMQKKMNLKIKYRESFRPFAPSVLIEEEQRFFELEKPSPYMLLVADVKEDIRKRLPTNYHALPVREKLYHVRSDIPAITHIDFSARLQTVHHETNPRYWQLIDAFRKETGYGVIVNTSFNVRGEPIVCTPEDAYKCFMRTEMDYLIMDLVMFSKSEQPTWAEGKSWREEFVLD